MPAAEAEDNRGEANLPAFGLCRHRKRGDGSVRVNHGQPNRERCPFRLSRYLVTVEITSRLYC